jgi:hypothetical protein
MTGRPPAATLRTQRGRQMVAIMRLNAVTKVPMIGQSRRHISANRRAHIVREQTFARGRRVCSLPNNPAPNAFHALIKYANRYLQSVPDSLLLC